MKRNLLLLLLFFNCICSIVNVYADDSIPAFLPRVVKIDSDAELDSLLNNGVEVLRRRGDIVLCLFPNTPTRSVAASQRPRSITPVLDVAKDYFDAKSIQNGTVLGSSYTGKGIVVGICDIGIDPLHPTFLDANGRSRIKRVVQYIERDGIRRQLEGDEDYRQWQTDNPEEYHATHVCGILAGGGAGSPYSGIATDADIVVSVSTLTEVGILAGVEDIIDYAKEVGNPAVINISLGSYNGAHDGSSLFSQYLDMCADDAIIVLSAGNEGTHKNSLISSFGSDQTPVSFRIGNRAWDNHKMYGVTEIWSGSDSPLEVSLGIYDSNERKIIKWEDPLMLSGNSPIIYSWDGSESVEQGFPFKGDFVVESEVNSENGRYCTSLGYDFVSEEQSSQGNWARYELAVKVSGEVGEDVEIYSDGSYSRLAGVSGSPQPSTDRSISDLACGFNVISVGMYGNRDSVPVTEVDKEVFNKSTGYSAGATVVYSSYGSLRDGRVLPLTVAPGATLMSAGDRYYFESHDDSPHLLIDDTFWVSCGGTSMSSPYVAGYIATWLEAVPTLTANDVKRIIAATNSMDIADPNDPRNANGYFDPVSGIKAALAIDGVDSIEHPDFILSPDDFVEVYDLIGTKRYAGLANGISGIDKGLYVVKTPVRVIKMILPK